VETHGFDFYALGSDCSLQFVTPSRAHAQDAAVAVEREVGRIEGRYSRYRPDSELSRINKAAAAGGTVVVDAETAGLLDYAYECFRISKGLFDITSGVLRKAWNFRECSLPDDQTISELLPRIGFDKVEWNNPELTFTVRGMELDLGGLGKEYAVDRAAEIAVAMGIEHGLVDFGGDIRVIGPHAGGPAWRIGVRHPRRSDALMTTFELKSGALATSGDYEKYIEVCGRRYCHILNPRSGWPAQGLQSVTVICDECLVAGSLATIAMLMGKDGADWLRSLNVRCVAMDEDGAMIGTEATGSEFTYLR
jgi:FAD:protein FMN transferase